jgi:protein-S-isoprenylcysteine O-methyltransferase Ste14
MAGAPWSIVGATSVLASAQQFANAEQDARPWVAQDKPPILFKGGPYRFSRNPMYLGEFLAQIGLGVMANNLWIPLLAFAALMVVRQTVVLPEEAYLRRELGTSYEEYLRSVRRWI